MRVRLLLDTELDGDEIRRLADLIAEQPVATVDIHGYGMLVGSRLMGAQPVPGEPLEK